MNQRSPAEYTEAQRTTPIPQDWVSLYVDELMAVAKQYDEESAMCQSMLLRVTHALELVEAFRETLFQPPATDEEIAGGCAE